MSAIPILQAPSLANRVRSHADSERPSFPDESLLHLRPDSCLRPLNWRWELAAILTDRLVPEPWRTHLSQQVGADVLHFVKAKRHGDGIMSDMHEAFGLRYLQPDLSRWELEARLLTGESFESIAARMGIGAAGVRRYEQMFFNVRDRLGYRGFLIHNAIGPRFRSGLSIEDVDIVLKAFALGGGPHVLDTLLDVFRIRRRQPPTPPESAILCKALVALFVLSSSEPGFLRLCDRCMGSDDALSNARRVLAFFRRTVGRRKARNATLLQHLMKD